MARLRGEADPSKKWASCSACFRRMKGSRSVVNDRREERESKRERVCVSCKCNSYNISNYTRPL